MTEFFQDRADLQLVEKIIAGEGVEVNVHHLAQKLKKHRNTIQNAVDALFEHGIINPPAYPFPYLYKEYPMLVIARADLPRTADIENFLKQDRHVFAAFYVRDEEYNTLVFEYHKDLYEYGEWRKGLIERKIIPPRHDRYPAQSMFFSNRHIIKYAPHYPLYKMEDVLESDGHLEINGLKMNRLTFTVMKNLMLGEGIRTNENLLSRKLDMHRKTVERKISSMIEQEILSKPVCLFPRILVPPSQLLVYTLMEVMYNDRANVLKAIKMDPSITMAIESNYGRYTYLLFSVFNDTSEHLEWMERYSERFPGTIGATKNIYLSPKMTASIDQNKVALGIIREKLAALQQ